MRKTKRFFMAVIMATTMPVATWAGGLMTNTNYHIAFDRMMARGATFDIDAAYSNPAGLVWNQHEGWQLSLNFQKPWQNRDIETTIPDFLSAPSTPTSSTILTTVYNQTFEGKASAPIVPALFAAYKQDRWVASAMIGIVGSGGFVKYDDGIPSFTVPIQAMLAQKGLKPDMYGMDAQMKGKQYIYGGQLNFSYQITDFLSAAVGVRANYYDGYNRGHVVANMSGADLINLQLDCIQRGWGFAPLVGAAFHQGPLTVAARYEFRTKINTENDTRELSARIKNTDPATAAAMPYIEGATALKQFGDKVTPYEDGVKTRYDMPSLLSVAVGYEVTPQMRVTGEYHYFDDKHAKMAGDRQKELSDGTHEILLGIEYDINDMFTVSCGGQRTDYGLADNYQQNTSFACDSYSFGLGGAVNFTEKLRLNVGYFMTIYSDYTKEVSAYGGTPYKGTEVYSRTNYVVGLGIDYRF